jgi:tetratricopeptide (TPR) repeat protein
MKRRESSVLVLISAFLLLGPAQAAAPDPSDMSYPAIAKRIRESTATEKDMATLIKIVDKDPSNLQANYLLAQYLDLKGFEQLAIDALNRAIKTDPNYGPAHYMRCVIFFRMNDLGEAMKEVDICEKLLAADGEKLFQIGLALDRTHQKERAKQFFFAAARAGRKGEGYGANLAQIRMAHKKYNEAMEAVEWDLKANPNDARANIVKSEILFKLGRDEEAVQCLVTAARSSPCEQLAANVATRRLLEGKRYKEALGTALLDLLCQKQNPRDMDKAKDVVFDLLTRMPDSESQPIVMSTTTQVEKSWRCRFFRFALADIYDRMNKPFRAIEQYQLGLHSCPAQLSDSVTQARGMYRMGRDYELYIRNYPEALDQYRRAAALAPQDREITQNYLRLKRRMANRKNDFAWKIKDAWYSFWRAFSQVQPN